MSEAEHRRAPRVARSLMARYRDGRSPGASWLMSPLRDLSSGGARFLSEVAFDVGSTLELQLLLPLAREPVSLKARVAWAQPARLGMVEVGVTFDPGDAAAQQSIDAAVAHFLHKMDRSG